MPNGSGFDLLERFGSDLDFKIIFITAYHEYALKGFKFSAVDYLLKPIDPDDLVKSVNRVKDSVVVGTDERIDALIKNRRQ